MVPIFTYRGIDKTKPFSLKKTDSDVILVQIYVLTADEARPEVDQTKYRGLIGSLLYLTARFQSSPKESHLKAAKRILKYLKGTTSMGLLYPSHSPIHLVGYSDSNFAGSKLDRKSTSEAKYIVVGSCCAQILWIKQQLEDFGLKISKIPLLCDNTSAINLTKNQVQHSRPSI